MGEQATSYKMNAINSFESQTNTVDDIKTIFDDVNNIINLYKSQTDTVDDAKTIFTDVDDIISNAKKDVTAKLNSARALDFKKDDIKIHNAIKHLYIEALTIFTTAKTNIKGKWTKVNAKNEYAKHLGHNSLCHKAERLLNMKQEISKQIDIVEKRSDEYIKNFKVRILATIERLKNQQKNDSDLKEKNKKKEDLESKIQQIRDFNNPNRTGEN
jgi:hypothetical protein